MDWKDLLASKVADGSLQREDSGQPAAEAKPASKDCLHIVTDRKGRKGKVATIIEGFTVSDDEVLLTAARLKTRLGIGGSARGGEILLQGDVAAKLRPLLLEMGYKVK